MKKILLLFLLLSFTYCSYSDCTGEDDPNMCTSHDVGINGFSCYETTEKIERACIAFPDDPEKQKFASNFYEGLRKELRTGIGAVARKIFEFDKDKTYLNKDDVISVHEIEESDLSTDDKAILIQKIHALINIMEDLMK